MADLAYTAPSLMDSVCVCMWLAVKSDFVSVPREKCGSNKYAFSFDTWDGLSSAAFYEILP
jgi:hypothetical protein